MAAPAIVADELVKCFGDVEAVKGVSFEVPEGKVLGVLGPNGAGKTTAVRMLTTLLKPDSGTARVLGVDVRKDPQRVRGQHRPRRPVRRRRREPHRPREPARWWGS